MNGFLGRIKHQKNALNVKAEGGFFCGTEENKMNNKIFLFSMAVLLLMVGLVNAAELNSTALNNITSPTIGGDEGQWGYIWNNNIASIFSYFTSINEFLFIGHLANGTHNISESEIFDLDKYTKAQTDTLINNEANARNNADSDLSLNVSTETANRQNADTSLNNVINSNNNTITNNLNAEISNRENNDTALLNSINTETTNRGTADTNLQNVINSNNNTLTTNLNTEVTNRESNDTILQTLINTEIANRINADSTHFTNANETDQVFVAWDKSTGISITESQISDLVHFTNADETDQIFTASVAFGVTTANITDWSTAFNWGNHALQGYLTLLGLQADYYNKSEVYNKTEIDTQINNLNANISNEANLRNNADSNLNINITNEINNRIATTFTNANETDQIYSASNASTITLADITNWNTIFNWNKTYNDLINKPVLGTLSEQNNNSVVITGGNIDNVIIGATAPSTAVFTNVTLGTVLIVSGVGSPETIVTAPIGSLFLRSDGGANTTMYVKESGVGASGWISK